jgi:uncharacterized protein YjbI with pentapeptide repeats
MKKVTQEELNEIITNHQVWLEKYLAKFTGCDDLSEVRELRAAVIDKDLSNLVFKNADLRYSGFSGCNFKGVNFDNIDFSYANLCYSNFEDALFVRTKLLYTDLGSTTFWNAIFDIK